MNLFLPSACYSIGYINLKLQKRVKCRREWEGVGDNFSGLGIRSQATVHLDEWRTLDDVIIM